MEKIIIQITDQDLIKKAEVDNSMELLELSSRLKCQQDEISDEIIRLLRQDSEYMLSLCELERKIAILVAKGKGSVLIKVHNGKLIF